MSLNSLALLRDLDPFRLFLLPFLLSFIRPFLFGVFGFSVFFFFSGVSTIGKGKVTLDTEERLEGGRYKIKELSKARIKKTLYGSVKYRYSCNGVLSMNN